MSCGCRQAVGMSRIAKDGIAFRLQRQAVQEESLITQRAHLVVIELLTAMYDEQILRGYADKSLTRPGRKQATATQLGIC